MKIEGKERLRKKLRAIPVAARAEIHAALEKSASELAATATSLAPKKTGALAASIGYTFGEYKPDNANVRGIKTFGADNGVGDPDLTVTVHVGDAKAFYAAFVEFGTQKSSAQPFFFPAYRLVKKRVKGRVTRATTKAAKAVAAGGQ